MKLSRIFIFILFLSSHAMAEVMNLNNYMPTQLEDATPIEKGTTDFQYSAVFEKKKNDVIVHRPNIRYGQSEDLQLETQATIESGGEEKFSGEVDLGVQYRFNRSKTYFPEISLNPVILFPTGKTSRAYDYSLKLNLTSTLIGNSDYAVTQLHFNILAFKNNDAQAQERRNGYEYLLGLSHRLLPETAIILDGVIAQNMEKGENNYLIELGVHHHLGKGYYLGAGYGQGLGSSEVSHQMLLALEKQFE